MVKPKRLAEVLKAHGFVLALDYGVSDILYSRPSEWPELWEQVRIDIAGKRGEFVIADVQANIRYAGMGGWGLFERRFVVETGGPPANPAVDSSVARKRLQGSEDAVKWERLVAEVCPPRARDFAREVGPALLERTADARAAVAKYMEVFGTTDWRELRRRLEPRATSRELGEAERISRTPPMIEIYNGREVYKTIILGVMLFSDRVEGRQILPAGIEVFPEVDPFSKKAKDWTKWAAVWRIDLLVDRMLGHYPNMMPSRFTDDEVRWS